MNFSIPPQTQTLLQKYLPLLAALILAIVLGQQIAKLFWLVFPAPEQGAWQPRPAQAAPTNATTQAKSRIDLALIKQAQLFGAYQHEDTVVAEPAAEDAPETKLRLKLRGIVAMHDADSSRALIESSNGQLESYAIGMTVSGGAELHKIYADRVLLKRAGRLETLTLEKDKLADNAVTTTASQDNRARGIGSAPRIINSETAAKLSNIRTELLNDPSKASQYLRVQPARSNGAMKGYRIYPGRKRELFKEAGLRPGDIVTAVNGVSLDDPGKGFQLLGDLSSAQQINLQIERGGQIQTVNVNLN